jgi:hypothetical protein
MSRYLIEQIEKTPNIRLRSRTEIAGVEGDGHVERVTLRSLDDGSCRTEEADAVFVFIGTRPVSKWLPDGVLRDAKGFVLTGRDLMAAEAYPRTWKEQREPFPLETSVAGVFAAGDVRAGAMKPRGIRRRRGFHGRPPRSRIPGADLIRARHRVARETALRRVPTPTDRTAFASARSNRPPASEGRRLYGARAANEMEDDEYQPATTSRVDETSRHVEREEAERPTDQQNDAQRQ